MGPDHERPAVNLRQYEEKTVERRVWTRPAPVVLKTDETA
jgi:hypothetical protein